MLVTFLQQGGWMLIPALALGIVNWIAVARKQKRVEYVVKPGTLILVIITALLLLRGADNTRLALFFVLGLCFSLAGDVFLMLPGERFFIPGLIAFFIAHVCYIIGLNPTLPPLGSVIVLMVVAALFYGAMNISVKLSVSYLTVWQTAMGRFVLGVVLLPPLVWMLRLELFGRDRWLLAARGLSATAAFLLMILAFQTVPLSVAMVLFYLWPVFSCLLSAWVAGEPTTRREWPFVCGALSGTTLILWPGASGTALSAGHFLALGAAFFAGLAIILVRRLGRNNNPFTLYFYFCLTGAVFCTGPFLAQESPALPLTGAGWIGLPPWPFSPWPDR